MNVYDNVNNLAKAIKDSKEYREYKEIKQDTRQDMRMTYSWFAVFEYQ